MFDFILMVIAMQIWIGLFMALILTSALTLLYYCCSLDDTITGTRWKRRDSITQQRKAKD